MPESPFTAAEERVRLAFISFTSVEYIYVSMYNKSVSLIPRYEESRAKGVDNYEVELENVIDKLIVECDKKIGRALKRLEDDDAKAAIAISVTEVTQVMKLFLFNSLCFLLNNLFFLNYRMLR